MKFPEPEKEEKIITLVGSCRFKKLWERIFKKLLERGWFVRGVECYGHADGLSFPEGYKEFLEEIHRERIKGADAIFIINKNGYIGESTREEITFAREKGKELYYYNSQA